MVLTEATGDAELVLWDGESLVISSIDHLKEATQHNSTAFLKLGYKIYEMYLRNTFKTLQQNM